MIMGMIETDANGHAAPGPWYDTYTAAWRQAFPESRDHPGFFLGSTWRTFTPAWDEWWFIQQGVNPPHPIVALATPWTPSL